ncbi:MAG TPA: DMT family transporter, partial [Candidatus Latescibacteria bacterium]|nr:DMT family transporter [Candidatus Latescibacterota bacterium]
GTLLGAAYAVYYTGLQRGSVAVVTGVGSGWLVVSVLIAVLAFGEALTAAQTLAIVLMLGGVALISTQRTVASGGPSGLGWGVLAMLTLGGALAMWKPLTEAAGPAVSVLVVRLIAAGSLYVYFRVRGGRPRLPLGSGTWRILAAAALDGAGFVAYNIGLDGAPLTVIAPLAAAHPLATIALAAVLLRERLTLAQGAGVGLTVSAVMALSVLVA